MFIHRSVKNEAEVSVRFKGQVQGTYLRKPSDFFSSIIFSLDYCERVVGSIRKPKKHSETDFVISKVFYLFVEM